MTNMRALIGGTGSPRLVEVPVPEAGPGQVRIRMAAAGVNPFDLAVAAGTLADHGVARKLDSYGLGFDVAGTVDQVGEGVAYLVGDEVIALVGRLELPVKAQAEYVVVDASAVAKAPRGASAVAAATIPLNALTGVVVIPLRGTDVASVFFRADAAQLAEVVRLVEAGRVTLRVAGTYPLEKAADAHARLAAGGVRGRLVLVP
ncbi:zinc-binding dehydrogenase [Nonomuraea sp. NPDC026600]|uniref:zinc-binding dehydrogenase n=1 Tax=Nonomuraea sp. NPDC026600 TaxID=3155363 RepID=UPI0033DF2294